MKKIFSFIAIILFTSFLLYSFFCFYFQPVSIVVPHHDIVKEKRLEYFQKIKRLRPITSSIIIIGPDHFSPNQNSIVYGNFLSSFDSKKEIKLSKFLSLQNGVIRNDHAVLNLLPDIKIVWPRAKVFPILIGQNVKTSSLNNLTSQIKTICGFDCLLISSVDFSHYLPSSLGDIHDTKSIYDLSIQNFSEISKLEVDSPQSLYIFSKFSNLKNAQKWKIFYHSNSSELENNRDAESTSHVFGSYCRGYPLPLLKTHTFVLAPNINRNENTKTIGSRFFYGVDDLNPKIILPFIIPNNFITAGSIVDSKVNLIFLPFEKQKEEINLLRGDKKTEMLDKFLSQFENNSKYFVDKFDGKLQYDQ